MTGGSNSSELSPSIELSAVSNSMQQGRKQKRNRRTVGEFVEKSFGDFEVNYGSTTSRSNNGSSTTGRFFSFLGLIDSDKSESNEDSISKPASAEKSGRSIWAYATVLTILMTLVTSLYLPALALLCVRRTVFVTSGSFIRTLLLVGRFCTLALLVILPVPSSENSESESANQVASSNNRSHGKLIGYLFQDRADAPKWIQQCVSIIEGNTVASTNNGKGDNRAWPPPTLTALAVITLVAFVVHPDGPTWMFLGKLRDGFQWVWQVCIKVFDILRNCKIPNSIIACTSIASLILFIGIIYRIVRIKDKDTKPTQPTEKVRHKHKKNKKGRGGGGRQNNNGGKAKLKNSHSRSNKESLNSLPSRSRSSSPSNHGPGSELTDTSAENYTLILETSDACTDNRTQTDTSKPEYINETRSNLNSKITLTKPKKKDVGSTVSEHSINTEDDKSCSSSLHSMSSSNSHNQYKKKLPGNQNSTCSTQKNYPASRPENSRRQRGRRGVRKTNSQGNSQKNSPNLHYYPPSPKTLSVQSISSVPTSPSTLQRRFDNHHSLNKGQRQNNRHKNTKRVGISETSNPEIRHMSLNSNRYRNINESMAFQNSLSPCSTVDLNTSKYDNKFTNNQNRSKLKQVRIPTRVVGVCKDDSYKTTIFPTSPTSQQNCSEAIQSTYKNMDTTFSHFNETSSSPIAFNHDNTIPINHIGSISNTHADQAIKESQNLNSVLNYNVPNYANSYSFSHGYHGRYSPGKMELAGFLAQVGLVGSSCAGILADLDDVEALERLSNAQFLSYNITFEKRRNIAALLEARHRRNTVEKHNTNSWKTAALQSAAPVRPPPGLEFNNETLMQSNLNRNNSNGNNLDNQLQSIAVGGKTTLCEKTPLFNNNSNNVRDQNLSLGLPFYHNQGYGFQTNRKESSVGMMSPLAQYSDHGEISSNKVKSQSSSMNIFNEDEIEANMQELGGQMAVSILDF